MRQLTPGESRWRGWRCKCSSSVIAFKKSYNLSSKDVRLPVQLQRAMAAEAEATREARAKVT